MKKVLVVSFMLINFISISYSQISPTSVAQLKMYYENNINTLDPIEGVYDVDIEQWGENAFRVFASEGANTTFHIYKEPDLGNYKVFEDKKITIKKIGNTGIYNYTIIWPGSQSEVVKRFILGYDTFFEISYSIPDKQLRYDMGRNYQAGFKVNYKMSFVKAYPTDEMYANAQKKEQNSTSKEWSGTGFALENGYVVTNHHVVDGAKKIVVQGIDGDFNTQYTATIVGRDKNNDLALLKITDTSFQGFGTIPYSITDEMADVGEDIFVLGYPLTSTMGDEIKLTTGIISSKTGFQGNVALYQISAPIQPGNSGGPLFDIKGNVIGVVSAKHAEAENVGYAIKAIYLRNLVESCASASIIPSINSVSTMPLTTKVKKEKNFVFYIHCSSPDSY